MTLEYHTPEPFFFHYSRAKERINLFIEGKCYVVDKVVNYGPIETQDIPTLHFQLSRGFTNKINIIDNTAMIY